MSRNRIVGSLEDSFERAQSSVATAAKQTAKDFTASAKGQITGGSTTASPAGGHQKPSHGGGSDHGTNENASAAQQHSDPATAQKTDEERQQFLRDLYGKSDHSDKTKSPHSNSGKSGAVKQALGVSEDPTKGLTPEEIAKLTALRNQLHSKYYQDLVNRPKPKEEPVAEKLEREKQMEAIEEHKKQEKKPGPLSQVKQGTAESVVGASG